MEYILLLAYLLFGAGFFVGFPQRITKRNVTAFLFSALMNILFWPLGLGYAVGEISGRLLEKK